jgi:Fuc2NAc and GlcNAc transferase
MILLFAAFAISYYVTSLAVLACRRFGIVDTPNERSSHVVVTPRGGGAGIYIPVLAAVLALNWFGILDRRLALALLAGGPLVVLAGLIDDIRGLPISVRLVTHLIAAGLAAGFILEPSKSGTGLAIVEKTAMVIVAAVAIVWMVNIYNFMDGIDGLAGGQAATGSLAMLMLAATVAVRGIGSLGMVLCGASLGFLVWNWPRARVFMGDAGSGFLGFLFACVGVAAIQKNFGLAWFWLVAFGVFVTDSSVTLAVRILRGERFYLAHRQHAYQHLAQRFGSHAKVALGAMLLNILWLLPLAWLSIAIRGRGAWIAFAALAPLAIAALRFGAGREQPTTHVAARGDSVRLTTSAASPRQTSAIPF